jgi:hypothetical protein
MKDELSDEFEDLSATKSIRNFLAHRSPSAKKQMQTALASNDLPVHLRRGEHRIGDVASFLQSKPTPSTEPRLLLYLAGLEEIAEVLCP